MIILTIETHSSGAVSTFTVSRHYLDHLALELPVTQTGSPAPVKQPLLFPPPPSARQPCINLLSLWICLFCTFKKNLHRRTWLSILEREEGGEREGDKHPCERDIDGLPVLCTLTGITPTTSGCRGRGSHPPSRVAGAFPAHFAHLAPDPM